MASKLRTSLSKQISRWLAVSPTTSRSPCRLPQRSPPRRLPHCSLWSPLPLTSPASALSSVAVNASAAGLSVATAVVCWSEAPGVDKPIGPLLPHSVRLCNILGELDPVPLNRSASVSSSTMILRCTSDFLSVDCLPTVVCLTFRKLEGPFSRFNAAKAGVVVSSLKSDQKATTSAQLIVPRSTIVSFGNRRAATSLFNTDIHNGKNHARPAVRGPSAPQGQGFAPVTAPPTRGRLIGGTSHS